MPLTAACLVELDEVVARLWHEPGPIERLEPERFPLAACAAAMARVRETLTHGIGLAVLDRIPVERYQPSESRAIGWLLASLLDPVVAQKLDGTRLYDVKDTGQTLAYGVRRSVTNLGQPFHTDGPWLGRPPAFVGLLCLEAARDGGISRFVSLGTVYERMRERADAQLARLGRPFWWDRQAEHAPGNPTASSHPVFAWVDGRLQARYYEDYVHNGYRLAGETLDDLGSEALATMRALVDDAAHWIEFRIEPGQFQYLANRGLAYSRTAFQDTGGESGRHLVRFWNRGEGTLDLEGSPVPEASSTLDSSTAPPTS